MIIEIDKISLLDNFNQILTEGEVLGDQVFVFDTFECFCQIKNNEIGSLLLMLDKMLPNYTTKHRVSIVKDTIVWEGVRSWKLEWEH